MQDLSRFFKIAKSEGIGECEFFYDKSRSYSVSTQKKKLKTKEFDIDAGYSVRVIHKGRVGFSSFQREEECKEAVRRAKGVSKFAKKSNFSFPEKRKYPKVKCYDRKISSLDEHDAKEFAEQLIEGVGKSAKSTECGVHFTEAEFAIENSSGLSANAKKTYLQSVAEANYKGSTGYDVVSSLFFKDGFYESGERAGEEAKNMHSAKKAEAGKYAIVLETEAISTLLGASLLSSFSGENARRGISRLVGKEGEKVATDEFTIYDDRREKGHSALPFDGEGVEAKRKTLIKGGVFRGFLYDRKTAAFARVKCEGNCGRGGYSDEPGVSNSNIVIAPGNIKKLEEEFEKCIVVKSFIGAHTSNPTTGDFSAGIDIGWKVEDGKRTPVRGNMAVGNVFDLLKQVAGIERKHRTYFNLISPRIAISDFQVVE